MPFRVLYFLILILWRGATERKRERNLEELFHLSITKYSIILTNKFLYKQIILLIIVNMGYFN